MVIVYTRSNCQACEGTKRQLDKQGTEFVAVNVEDDLDIAQQLVDEGWRSMPVVKTSETSWSGMNMARIRALAM